MTVKDVTSWIADELRKRGLSQAALARHLGLDPASVSNMLKGRRKISIDELAQIEQFLGVSSPWRGGASAEPPPAVTSALSVEVVGVVAGGIWREDRAPKPYTGETVVPAVLDPRFAGKEQKALRVEGSDLPSVPIGAYAIFVECSPDYNLRPRDIVYVRRTKGDLTEHGLWRVSVSEQNELRLERNKDGSVEIIAFPSDEAFELTVAGHVIGFYIPAT